MWKQSQSVRCTESKARCFDLRGTFVYMYTYHLPVCFVNKKHCVFIDFRHDFLVILLCFSFFPDCLLFYTISILYHERCRISVFILVHCLGNGLMARRGPNIWPSDLSVKQSAFFFFFNRQLTVGQYSNYHVTLKRKEKGDVYVFRPGKKHEMIDDFIPVRTNLKGLETIAFSNRIYYKNDDNRIWT